MKKIIGLEVIADMVNAENLTKQVSKSVRDERIKFYIAQGIDKQTATAMVDAFISCGIS